MNAHRCTFYKQFDSSEHGESDQVDHQMYQLRLAVVEKASKNS